MRKLVLVLTLIGGVTTLQIPVQTQNEGRILDAVNVPGLDKPVRVILGRFRSDVTLTNNFYWVLRGAVFIDSGADLTIQAGTRIVGEFATLGTLIIDRGARILAEGTADAPIVFTSDQPIGERGRGDWGGLILNGRATINGGSACGAGCSERPGEGDTGLYGGANDEDNSGVLRYVRVEYAGIEFSPDNELNGIAFQGVGRGTQVDYIQVKYNKDDGVEFFGGTVDAKHLVLTANGDDNMDSTNGWRGRIQFVVIQQRGDDADNGFEWDNEATNNSLLPRNNPTVYNATVIGDPTTNFGNESDDGMEIREGTAGTVRNFIVTGWKEYGLDISNEATVAEANAGRLSFGSGIFFNNAILSGHDNLDSDAKSIPSIVDNPTLVFNQDPGLIDPHNAFNPNFRPRDSATLAMQLAPAIPPNDGFFEIAPFIGALSSDPAQDWTQGWTDYSGF